MTTFNVQVLFENTRAVLSAFAEGRAPEEATETRYEQQHGALYLALLRLETAEATQLADTIGDLCDSIHDVHEGLRPDAELASEIEARLGVARELRQQIAERHRRLEAADRAKHQRLKVNVRWQLDFADSLVGHLAAELNALRTAELGLPKASQELLALMERAVALLANQE